MTVDTTEVCVFDIMCLIWYVAYLRRYVVVNGIEATEGPLSDLAFEEIHLEAR
jgi:hypothetical protein